jgi:superfamily I DNA/RNA helicase
VKKKLTEDQKEIVSRNGYFVVKACPGSGKTYAVAAKLADKIKGWKQSYKGIATFSFTNVAWKEIQSYLNKDFKIQIPVGFPHFLGTLDSFFNQNVFLPFGHLFLGCKKRPELIGPPFNEWEPIGNGFYWKNAECNKYSCKLNDFSFDVGNYFKNFSSMSHFDSCGSKHEFCKKMKKDILINGYATQLDANFISLSLLKSYPTISKALALRFSEIIIDEAQDSSEIQMNLIETLIQNGVKEVMFIGDSDQSIYEWRTAKPSLFLKKYQDWLPNSFEMKTSLRSSQNICNFYSKLSSFDSPPNALNEELKDFAFKPVILSYEDNYQTIIDNFMLICETNGIQAIPKNIAILARSKNLISSIKNIYRNADGGNPWRNDPSGKICQKIAKSKFKFDQKEYIEALKIIERLIVSINLNRECVSSIDIKKHIERKGFSNWRVFLFKFLSSLPKSTGELSLKEWLLKLDDVVVDKFNKRGIDLRGSIKRDRKPNKYSEVTFGELFSISDKYVNERYSMGTIHSVKGETYDAILLFVKERCANNQKYKTILNDKIEECEELRNIYVAITRPRKVLVIAVPEKDKDIWEKKFYD